ncbi:GNAT family N-acetyltransferase, partial [Treponema lecithinolyticum]
AEWLNNEEVSRYLTVASKVISLEAEKEVLAELAKTRTYGIIENETEKLIGNISLMNIDNVQQTALLHML